MSKTNFFSSEICEETLQSLKELVDGDEASKQTEFLKIQKMWENLAPVDDGATEEDKDAFKALQDECIQVDSPSERGTKILNKKEAVSLVQQLGGFKTFVIDIKESYASAFFRFLDKVRLFIKTSFSGVVYWTAGMCYKVLRFMISLLPEKLSGYATAFFDGAAVWLLSKEGTCSTLANVEHDNMTLCMPMMSWESYVNEIVVSESENIRKFGPRKPSFSCVAFNWHGFALSNAHCGLKDMDYSNDRYDWAFAKWEQPGIEQLKIEDLKVTKTGYYYLFPNHGGLLVHEAKVLVASGEEIWTTAPFLEKGRSGSPLVYCDMVSKKIELIGMYGCIYRTVAGFVNKSVNLKVQFQYDVEVQRSEAIEILMSKIIQSYVALQTNKKDQERFLLTGGTGSGKSTDAMIRLCLALQKVNFKEIDGLTSFPKQLLVINPRNKVCKALSDYLNASMGHIVSGVCVGGFKANVGAPILFCTPIMGKKYAEDRFVVIDEAHVDEDHNYNYLNLRQPILFVTGTPKEVISKGWIQSVTASLPATTPFEITKKVVKHASFEMPSSVKDTIRSIAVRGGKVMVFYDEVKVCKKWAAEMFPDLKCGYLVSGDMEIKDSTQVYFSTSCAEDGFTLPGVELVVNFSFCWRMTYTSDYTASTLVRYETSDSINTQRKGRTGRTCKGEYIQIDVPNLPKMKPVSSPIEWMKKEQRVTEACLMEKYCLPADVVVNQVKGDFISKILDSALRSAGYKHHFGVDNQIQQPQGCVSLNKWLKDVKDTNFQSEEFKQHLMELGVKTSLLPPTLMQGILTGFVNAPIEYDGMIIKDVEVKGGQLYAMVKKEGVPGFWPFKFGLKSVSLAPLKISFEGVIDYLGLRDVNLVQASLSTDGFQYYDITENKMVKAISIFFSRLSCEIGNLKRMVSNIEYSTILDNWNGLVLKVSGVLTQIKPEHCETALLAWPSIMLASSAVYDLYVSVKERWRIWNTNTSKRGYAIAPVQEGRSLFRILSVPTALVSLACLYTLCSYEVPVAGVIKSIPFVVATYVISKQKAESDSLVKMEGYEKSLNNWAFKALLFLIIMCVTGIASTLPIIESYSMIFSYATGLCISILFSRSTTFQEKNRVQFKAGPALAVVVSAIALYNKDYATLVMTLFGFVLSNDTAVPYTGGLLIAAIVPWYFNLFASFGVYLYNDNFIMVPISVIVRNLLATQCSVGEFVVVTGIFMTFALLFNLTLKRQSIPILVKEIRETRTPFRKAKALAESEILQQIPMPIPPTPLKNISSVSLGTLVFKHESDNCHPGVWATQQRMPLLKVLNTNPETGLKIVDLQEYFRVDDAKVGKSGGQSIDGVPHGGIMCAVHKRTGEPQGHVVDLSEDDLDCFDTALNIVVSLVGVVDKSEMNYDLSLFKPQVPNSSLGAVKGGVKGIKKKDYMSTVDGALAITDEMEKFVDWTQPNTLLVQVFEKAEVLLNRKEYKCTGVYNSRPYGLRVETVCRAIKQHGADITIAAGCFNRPMQNNIRRLGAFGWKPKDFCDFMQRAVVGLKKPVAVISDIESMDKNYNYLNYGMEAIVYAKASPSEAVAKGTIKIVRNCMDRYIVLPNKLVTLVHGNNDSGRNGTSEGNTIQTRTAMIAAVIKTKGAEYAVKTLGRMNALGDDSVYFVEEEDAPKMIENLHWAFKVIGFNLGEKETKIVKDFSEPIFLSHGIKFVKKFLDSDEVVCVMTRPTQEIMKKFWNFCLLEDDKNLNAIDINRLFMKTLSLMFMYFYDSTVMSMCRIVLSTIPLELMAVPEEIPRSIEHRLPGLFSAGLPKVLAPGSFWGAFTGKQEKAFANYTGLNNSNVFFNLVENVPNTRQVLNSKFQRDFKYIDFYDINQWRKEYNVYISEKLLSFKPEEFEELVQN